MHNNLTRSIQSDYNGEWIRVMTMMMMTIEEERGGGRGGGRGKGGEETSAQYFVMCSVLSTHLS